jgi:hypothetical protein
VPLACDPAVATAANQRLPVLSRVVVAGTDGEGVFVRKSPRLDDRLQAWSDGTRLDVVGRRAAGDTLLGALLPLGGQLRYLATLGA